MRTSVLHSKTLLDIQGHAIRAHLPEGRPENLRRRRYISRLLERKCVGIAKHLKPEVVFEIGAHEATFSRHMREALPEARVIAFEANDRVHERFAQGLSELDIDYRHQCVAAEPGRKIFTIPITETGRERSKMGSLLHHLASHDSRSCEVEAVRLDDLGLTGASNVIWLDVEGAIGDVLDGASATLSKTLALFAELESASRWNGQLLDTDVIERLADCGLFPVVRDFQKPGQYNALFLRPEALADPKIVRTCMRFVGRATARVPSIIVPETAAA